MKIIAVTTNKDGVGKTSAAVNLADALGRKGRRVLLVDADSQCNATQLLLPARSVPRKTLYDIFDPTTPTPDLASLACATKCTNVKIVPNIPETAGLEPEMIRKAPESFYRLRDCLRLQGVDLFDYAIIDTPPNLGSFVLSALYAADFALVPIRAGSAFSVDGLANVMGLIQDLRNEGIAHLKFLRLLINGLDKRTSTSRDITTQVQEAFSEDQVFNTVIPINTAFEKAEAANETVLRYDGTSPGARAYRELADELVGILEG